ncbi:Reverse transcriptase zinc-binding domain [Macleaya cordata]|uniref:Reverse transcriptase zinc-binding domain n=1 Tax=Macleaya cordata TaxID=56857 RepID=A0A200PV35_MACCD|nr:Reverse transcriptase zinc-binding domain [Macleaya cordata]
MQADHPNITWIKDVSPRVHTFIWRILHNGIGVNDNSSKFVEGVINECAHCHNGEESVAHLLLHCSVAQAVLFASPLNLRVRTTDSIPSVIARWIKDHDGERKFCLGACLFWSIWKSRNKVVFEKSDFAVDNMVEAAMKNFHNFFRPTRDGEDPSTLPSPNRTLGLICWSPPPTNCIKINVDGATCHLSSAAAAVARDSEGSFLGCGSDILNQSIPIVVEAHAIFIGIQLALKINSSACIIEGDASMVIDILKGEEVNTPWRIKNIMSKIKSVASTIPTVEFSYVNRKANGAAHALAKHSVSFSISDWWSADAPPSCISNILYSEKPQAV